MVIFIVWVVCILLEQKININHIKKYFKVKIFAIPFEDTKILEFNQYQKSDKATFIICAGLKCLIGRIDGCKNNRRNSSTKVDEKWDFHKSMWAYFIMFLSVCNIII